MTPLLVLLLLLLFYSRHAGHCWRSRDELIRDVLLWTPTHDRAKAGRPARTYIQQLCEDTGCCPEDLPRAMNDREKWRERVRDIRATSAIWWWWFYSLWVVNTSISWWALNWSLSDCKSPKVSRTFLGILGNLNNAVVWRVFILPLISNCSNPLFNPLRTISGCQLQLISQSPACSTVF